MLIGIPHFNDFEGLKDCVNSLYLSANLGEDDTLLIMNADEKYNEKIQNFLSTLPKGFSVEEQVCENKGPLYAYNLLFETAKLRKQDLFLTQTDVYFPQCKKDWLSEMRAVAQNPNCGMITCWGGGGISGPDFIDGYRWIGAWCTYIPYKVIEKCGAFDENIINGWGVDVDYSYRVVKAGFQNYQIDYWVQHMPDYIKNHKHEQREDIEYVKKEAYRYMREKHKIGEYSE